MDGPGKLSSVRRQERLQTLTSQHFDVVVIGGGPAGYASALYGASAGLNIAIIEKDKMGGTCLNVGCIPAKELLETASVARTVAHAGDFGIQVGPLGLEWDTTLRRKQTIVDQLVGGLTGLLKNRKVTIFDGIGRLASRPSTVSVTGGASDGVTLTADAVILAAGSVPRSIDGFPIDDRRIVTSDELLSIPELPASAVVIGGGAIGCEFASMMSDLGTEVTILEYAPKILPGCDQDATRVVERSFKKRGIEIRTGVAVKSQVSSDDDVTVTFGGRQRDERSPPRPSSCQSVDVRPRKPSAWATPRSTSTSEVSSSSTRTAGRRCPESGPSAM